MKLFIASMLFSGVCSAAPQVVYSQGTITAIADKLRPPTAESLEILEQDGCSTQKGGKKITLNSGCHFMRGLYRYAFTDKEKKATRTVFVEFTAFRTPQGHGFISAAPLELVN